MTTGMNQHNSGQQTTESNVTSTPYRRSLAEWITLLVSTTFLALLVGLIVYDWQVNQTRPPAFEITIANHVRETDRRYYLPFAITNTGGRIARTVQVVAELHFPNAVDEVAEQQIDFLSGHERKQGSFVFTHNPLEGDLMVRVASYRLP
jgi:uncharacterized protein (TIGR02588 family)